MADPRESIVQALRAVAQPMVGQIPAGLTGLYEWAKTGDAAKGAEASRAVEDAFAYTPTDEGAISALGKVGEGVEWAGEQLSSLPGADTAQQGWEDFTVSNPAAAAMVLGGVETLNKPGKAAKTAKAASTAAKKAKVIEVLRDPLPGEVLRSKPALTAAGLEPDIVRSINNPKAYPEGYVPGADIENAIARRAALRQEPATTPGADASEAEWAKWGQDHGVNMTVTPMQSLGITDLTSGREVMIPGGLDGTFTIPDLFALKGRNFDPGSLPQDVHNKLMKKFERTYARPATPDDVDTFNSLNFSLLSPNAPLTQNEFLAMRARVRTPEELSALAAREPNKATGVALDQELGVGAASRGGMGVKGTAGLENMAAMGNVIKKKPEVFQAGPGEDVRDVTYRVMNQVPGLSTKTASLGTPFLDLAKGDTSAVDLHMIRNSFPRMLAEDSKVGRDFRKRMATKMGVTDEGLDAAIAAKPKKAEKAAIDVIGGSSVGKRYRNAKGELHGGADPRVTPDRLLYEPKQVQDFNPFYKRVVEYVDESRGPDPELPLFQEQWRLWDTYRQRVEPHEFTHPDYRKLPKQSFNEMQKSLDAHKAAGYTQSKNKVMKEEDWRKLYYGKADPKLLAAIAAAGAGGAAALPLVQALRNEEQN